MADREESGSGVADVLLAELEAGGELVDDGRFSIDAAQARKKLRAFQLAEGEAYAALLVEAAVLAGVSPVEVEVEGAQLRLWLGPVPASRAELEQLFAAAFVDLSGCGPEERRHRRVLQKLAFACNAALGLEPRVIEIESIGGEEELCLRLTPKRELGELTLIEDVGEARPGLAIRVDRGRVDRAPGELREVELLREACKYAPFPIHVAGERVDRGQREIFNVVFDEDALRLGSRGLKVRPIILDGVEIGLAGFRYGGRAPAELAISTNGVLAERVAFGDEDRPAAPDFTAIVNVDLAKDLSLAKVMRGPAFEAVAEAVWLVHDAIAPQGFGSPRKGPPAKAAGVEWFYFAPLVSGVGAVGAFFVVFVWGSERAEDIGWLLALATLVLGLAVANYGKNHSTSDLLEDFDDDTGR